MQARDSALLAKFRAHDSASICKSQQLFVLASDRDHAGLVSAIQLAGYALIGELETVVSRCRIALNSSKGQETLQPSTDLLLLCVRDSFGGQLYLVVVPVPALPIRTVLELDAINND